MFPNFGAMSLNTGNISIGSIFGSSGSQNLINKLNGMTGGGSFYDNRSESYQEELQYFQRKIVNPIRATHIKMENLGKTLREPDRLKPIISLNDVETGIPTNMYLPILYSKTIRSLLENGAIDGWGCNPRDLRDEDPYEHILNSGRIEIYGDHNPDMITEEWWSEDPDWTEEDVEAVRQTREYIQQFYSDPETKIYDFTDYPNLHN